MDGTAVPLQGEQVVLRGRAPEAASRIDFLSATRGAAVLFIALDHAQSIARTITVEAESPAEASVFAGFDAFQHFTSGTRLSVLVFMAGLFLERSLAHGARRFLERRAATLFWPLLLWGLVQGLVFALAPWAPDPYASWGREGFATMASGFRTLNPIEVLQGWWVLSGPTWFLDMLAVFVLAFLVLRWLPARLVLAGGALVFAASLIVGRPMANPVATSAYILGSYFLYFWLGAMSFDWAVRRQARLTPFQAAVCAGLFLAIALTPLWLRGADWRACGFVASLPAIPLFLNLGRLLLRTPARGLLLWAGRGSLLILCLHMSFEILIAAGVVRAGLASPLLVGVASLVGGLGLCAAADFGLRRAGWSAALGFRPAGS